jgi:hypothetical protein
MLKFLRQLFTESDNVTFDVTKVLAALAIITGLALAIVSVVWKNAPLNMQDYGTGMGLLFAGVGAALGLKKESGVSQ